MTPEQKAIETLKEVIVMIERKDRPVDAIISWIDYAVRQLKEGVSTFDNG
jgi:hypothetical protein